MLLRLCEQACNDGEWLAALKLLSLHISSRNRPDDGVGNDVSTSLAMASAPTAAPGTSTSSSPSASHFIIYVLENIEEDEDFQLVLDNDLHNLLQLIHKHYKTNAEVLLQLSKIFFRSELHMNALEVAQEVVALDFENATALETFENICCHMMDRWHFIMLNDISRNNAYEKAIHEIMSQRHRHTNVLDVGCGTGLLSFLAAKWSNKVYAVEMSSLMCRIAENTLKSYDLDEEIMEKITIINKMSTDLIISVDIQTRFDVLVTEIFDAGLFGEGILTTLTHAWKKLLKSGGKGKNSTVIPHGATLYVQGIESKDIRRESNLIGWKYSVDTGNINIRSNVSMLQSDPYTSVRLDSLPSGYSPLMSSKEVLCVNFNDPKSIFEMNEGLSNSLVLDVTKEGLLDALCVWFKLHLTDSIEVSTEAGTAGCWEQAIFPVSPVRVTQAPDSRGCSSSQSLKVCTGDKVTVEYTIKEDRLSMGVSSVSHQLEESLVIKQPSGFPSPHWLLSHPLEWCPFNMYCLSDWEVRALNDTLYQEKLLEALDRCQSTLAEHTSRFYHLNDGFSPLCLQALSHDFHAVQVLTPEDSHKALLWKLVQLNKLDVRRIKPMEDVSELLDDMATNDSKESPENPVGGVASSQNTEEGKDGAIFVFDLVDHTGRLAENWTYTLESIKTYSSMFKSVHILPEVVDIWGVLIESDSLLRRNRVITNDNVLGFPVKDHVNHYSTINHPDLCMSTLKHTKLTSPFKMFTLNFTEELNKGQHLEGETDKLDGNHNASHNNGMNEGEERTMHGDFFKNETHTMKVPTVTDGRIDALMYWFDLHLSPCHRVSTSDLDHHWNQAAVVLDLQTKINEGEDMHLKLSLQKSSIFVSVLK